MTNQNVNQEKPAVLVILDGFGLPNADPKLKNAILEADTPHFDDLFATYPHSVLHTSGEAVGLPDGQMGNSEIGHLTIGAGRVIHSDIVRISASLDSGDFSANLTFNQQMEAIKADKGKLHLMGLLSDGGVHSHVDHLKKIIFTCSQKYCEVPICLHAFLDGRDTAPTSGAGFVDEIQEFIKNIKNASLVSIIGRYYAMDRDKRWERIEKAYRLMVEGDGVLPNEPTEMIRNFYAKKITDEFMEPIVCKPRSLLENGDGVFFFNFRADRARQLTQALTQPKFSEFGVKNIRHHFMSLVEYDETWKLPSLFLPNKLTNILGEVVSNHQIKQLRLAETEKYAHITFFFNGGKERAFKNEERILIPSPKVATYDLKPEMSALLIKETLIEKIQSRDYALIIVNFANGDMVGHTGNLQATIAAVETLDFCIGEIKDAVISNDFQMIITADHGNCEQMLANDQKTPFTQHTTAPVPLIYVANEIKKGFYLKDGTLADVAPTLLKLMGLQIPSEMTGRVLSANSS